MSTGTLLFSGTDLATVCIVEDLSEFWSSADVRGDLPVYAGTSGATAQRRPVASSVRSGQVSVVKDTLAAAEDGVAAVKALLRIGQAQTVTRRKVTGAGNLDTTQSVIVRTAAERWAGDLCTLILAVETLDGIHSVKEIHLNVTATQSVAISSINKPRVPHGATGGIVTRPTVALIGEAGPEAVVPLNRTAGSSPLPAGIGGSSIDAEQAAYRGMSRALADSGTVIMSKDNLRDLDLLVGAA